ncbi:MAG: endo alpha-1,4 polygalactosaminidase [Kineosporiaceae bacterium]
MNRRWRAVSAGVHGRLPAAVVAVIAVLAAVPAAGCGTPVELPPTGAAWDYQLGGAYPPDPDVEVVVRDVSAPAPEQYGVCYLNAFQTQPGALATWRSDHPGLLLRDEAGDLVRDPAWPDEAILDLGSRENRAVLVDLLSQDVDECARRGHEAVELDNLDSWTRSGGAFGPEEAMTVAVAVAAQARRHGLAVGQKNASDLLGRADLGAAFDFAVVEECARYDECDDYRDVYGDRVLQVEYADAPGAERAFRAACRDGELSPGALLRDRDLVPAGDPGHLLRRCG